MIKYTINNNISMDQSIKELIKENIGKYIMLEFKEAKIISLTGLIKDSKFVYGKKNEYIIDINDLIQFYHSVGYIYRLFPKFVKVGEDYKGYKFLTIIKISKKDDFNDNARLSWKEYSKLKNLIHIVENERNQRLDNKTKTK